jgi:hypothetical protein
MRRRQKFSESATPLSDGSDRISLVSIDWVLIRFNPKEPMNGSFESSPFNLSNAVAKTEEDMRARTKPNVCGRTGRDWDKEGRGGAEYGI